MWVGLQTRWSRLKPTNWGLPKQSQSSLDDLSTEPEIFNFWRTGLTFCQEVTAFSKP